MLCYDGKQQRNGGVREKKGRERQGLFVLLGRIAFSLDFNLALPKNVTGFFLDRNRNLKEPLNRFFGDITRPPKLNRYMYEVMIKVSPYHMRPWRFTVRTGAASISFRVDVPPAD